MKEKEEGLAWLADGAPDRGVPGTLKFWASLGVSPLRPPQCVPLLA